MTTRFVQTFLAGAFCLSALTACLGIGSEITLRRDGSGTARLEYRLSRELESLGKLDGNAPWPPVPVGKADFERTAARIPGLALRSFASSAEGTDTVCRVTLDFAGAAALTRFLDAAGQGASLTRDGGRNLLALQIGGGRPAVSADLGELAALLSSGYSLDLAFSLPSPAELTLTGEAGRPLAAPPHWRIAAAGTRVSFSAPMGDLLLFDGPLFLEIRWDL
jgi:hypothetical protein